MTSGYPASLDTFATTSPTNLADDDTQARNHAERHDDIGDAMNKVQAELGTDPAGAYATVKDRLEAGRHYSFRKNTSTNVMITGRSTSGGENGVGRLYATYLHSPIQPTAISFQVDTAAADTSLAFHIYAPTSDWTPTLTLIDSFASVDTSTTGWKSMSKSWAQLPVGLVWVGVAYTSAVTSGVALRAGGNATPWLLQQRDDSNYGAIDPLFTMGTGFTAPATVVPSTSQYWAGSSLCLRVTL